MTKEEAWKVIETCKGWNVDQKGFTPEAQEALNEKRKTLAKAWQVVGDTEYVCILCKKPFQ